MGVSIAPQAGATVQHGAGPGLPAFSLIGLAQRWRSGDVNPDRLSVASLRAPFMR
jgi:hypothetical protein